MDDLMAASFLEAIRAFYDDPKHVEEFEKWRENNVGDETDN